MYLALYIKKNLHARQIQTVKICKLSCYNHQLLSVIHERQMQIHVLFPLLSVFLNLLHQKCKPCNIESHDKLLKLKRVLRLRIYFMILYTCQCYHYVWATLASLRSSSEK